MKALVVAGIVILLGVGVFIVLPESVGHPDTPSQVSPVSSGRDGQALIPGDTAAGDQPGTVAEGIVEEDDSGDVSVVTESAEKAQGTYEPYSEEKLSQYAGDKIVLFFHAKWCPICVSLEKEIQASPEVLPSRLHILVADFDTALELRSA